MAKRTQKRRPSFLITAGPTREYFDPVRFISNPSSGKMGIALASASVNRASHVTLCLGPVASPKIRGVRIKRFESAVDLLRLVEREMKTHDILIMTAAVCDFRPSSFLRSKIKKNAHKLRLRLVKNPDILCRLVRRFQGSKKFFAGFAAETDNVSRNAIKKLHEKNIHMIMANRVFKEKRGFSTDASQIKVFIRGETRPFCILKGEKKDIAKSLIPIIIDKYALFTESCLVRKR
ncbi:MAG: phosphopantothenoylcysteine decarboxylase [Candidatus Aureabacteria bacterium]|nr:phosphopantothenoylcysteine decarboxylase [Candidatus Auribacterota bacterium]